MLSSTPALVLLAVAAVAGATSVCQPSQVFSFASEGVCPALSGHHAACCARPSLASLIGDDCVAPTVSAAALADLLRQADAATYTVVLVFARWCPFSAEFQRGFVYLAHHFPQLCFVSADATLSPSLATRFSLRGYPALMVFEGSRLSASYSGDRVHSDLEAFIAQRTGALPTAFLSEEAADWAKDRAESHVFSAEYSIDYLLVCAVLFSGVWLPMKLHRAWKAFREFDIKQLQRQKTMRSSRSNQDDESTEEVATLLSPNGHHCEAEDNHADSSDNIDSDEHSADHSSDEVLGSSVDLVLYESSDGADNDSAGENTDGDRADCVAAD